MLSKMFTNHFGRFENVECGLVSLSERGEDGAAAVIEGLPLESVSINATVTHGVGKVELNQVYVNNEKDRSVETLYYFPLESAMGVTYFHAELEGRIIKGTIQPVEEAQAKYERAIGQKQSAFVIGPNRPEIFKVRIGFLKPGRDLKIVLHYVTQVKNERGTNGIGFSFPTTLIPNYIPPTGLERKQVPVKVIVDVGIQGNLKSIDSPSHAIQLDRDLKRGSNRGSPGQVQVTADLIGGSPEMEREFEFTIIPDDIHVPRIYTERTESGTALMAHYVPTFKKPKQKVELIFLLDRSGSMKEYSIELAKRALKLFLHSMPVDCFFNIVGFGYRYEFLFPQSRRYDEQTLRMALDYAEDLTANMGGTEILAPLIEIYNQDEIRGYNRQIFVLTDGEVENAEEVINMCRSNAKNTRVFTLGIGYSVSVDLVEGMANVAGGTATFVTDNEAFDSQVLQHLANAVEHSLTNIRAKWIGIDESEESRTFTPPPTSPNPKIPEKVRAFMDYAKEQISRFSPIPPAHPKELPLTKIPEQFEPVFDGQQFVVFGLFPGQVPTGLEVEADSPDGPLSLLIEVPEGRSAEQSGLIQRLATIKAIRYLEAKEAELGRQSEPNRKEREDIRAQIVNLSCAHGVVSRYTAYVVVDKINPGSNDNTQWVALATHDYKYAQGRWIQAPETFSCVLDDGQKVSKGIRSKGRVVDDNANISMGAIEYRPRSASPSSSSSLRMSSRSSTPTMLPIASSPTASGSQTTTPTRTLARTPTTPTTPAPFPTRSSPATPTNTPTSPTRPPPPRPPLPGPSSLTERIKALRPIRFARKSNEDILHAIVATQSYNGSFPLSQEFCEAIGSNWQTLREEAKQRGWDDQGWATGIAITYLTEKLGGLKESWGLVAYKARKWLEVNHPGQCTLILSAAHEFFHGSTAI